VSLIAHVVLDDRDRVVSLGTARARLAEQRGDEVIRHEEQILV
jgi:hypothetical protein